MIRTMALLCIVSLCWNTNAVQAQAVTSEALLDAYYDLWHQLERQPTAAEVESQTPFTADRYLQEWQDWNGVRQALIDHLYQNALFAALQQNTERAADYYARILEIDPNHPQARQAYQADLDEAAQQRSEFTTEKAGSPALSSFLSFLTFRSQGNEQAARDYFMLAQSQKAAYIASEIEKLQDMFDSAVELLNQGSFAEAIDLLQVLSETNRDQIGYEEFYLPNAASIREYLAEALQGDNAARDARFRSRSEESRFSVWLTGNWMARFGEMGLQGTYLSFTESGLTRVPLIGFKLAPKSFLGGDLGVSYRVTDFLWAGASWSQLILTPYAEVTQGNLEGTHKIQAGSFSALAVFVEPSTMISRTARVYLQAGAARYSADFPDSSLGVGERQPRLSPHTSASIGGFLGGGCDVWFLATESSLLGIRMDLKYHRMTGDDGDTNRSIELNGLRIGAGLVFSM